MIESAAAASSPDRTDTTQTPAVAAGIFMSSMTTREQKLWQDLADHSVHRGLTDIRQSSVLLLDSSKTNTQTEQSSWRNPHNPMTTAAMHSNTPTNFPITPSRSTMCPTSTKKSSPSTINCEDIFDKQKTKPVKHRRNPSLGSTSDETRCFLLAFTKWNHVCLSSPFGFHQMESRLFFVYT
jgi:hypothetical protein